ncbi:uncharacterized protein BDV17DRAFT_294780 [Aspergillus undulatus]|uniref:uncharacterized protein n=1 Tax=Aspergillus undulatus TaxID=1810928 RepID=UPI003CCD6A59
MRTKGNHKEAEAYKALGKFPHLTKLKLQLEIGRGKGGWMPDAMVCNTLINTAVDADLARAIFRRIITAGASSLERLQVTLNPEFMYPTHLADITRAMARQWQCIRVSGTEDRDASRRDALTRDFGVVARDMKLC